MNHVLRGLVLGTVLFGGAAAAAVDMICTEHRQPAQRTYKVRAFRGVEQWEYHCPAGHSIWAEAPRRDSRQRVGERIDDRVR